MIDKPVSLETSTNVSGLLVGANLILGSSKFVK